MKHVHLVPIQSSRHLKVALAKEFAGELILSYGHLHYYAQTAEEAERFCRRAEELVEELYGPFDEEDYYSCDEDEPCCDYTDV